MAVNSEATVDDYSLEQVRTLQISSLDDEPEELEGEEVCDAMDDDEGHNSHLPVTLGFVEKPMNGWSLLRQLFPSKAGGLPAWLDPVNLPSEQSSVCGFCGEPLQFLLQVYAPICEKESTFHRTLFVFICSSMACLLRDQHEQWKHHQGQSSSRSVKVFRSQLPHHNPYYSSEPPSYDGRDLPSGIEVSLCNWCGTWKGNKLCSSCRKARYCSEKHQVLHWRSGHKIDCQRTIISSELDSSPGKIEITVEKIPKAASKNLWPEYEIICVDESDYDADVAEDGTHASTLASVVHMNETANSILENFEGDNEKESWASFQERIAKAPEQVLRYCRSVTATPLWPMSSGRPSPADIPKCSLCGGLRSLELQVLPQLLYYFGVKNDADSLDWATIVVYTCEASCEAGPGCREEFAWVQLSSPSATVL